MSVEGTIRFGVVGCGHIGRRHASLILQQPHAELVALCDTDDAARAALPEEVRQLPFYPDLTALLAAHPECDVVCLCTPNGLHAEQCLEVLEARRHVVVEKPMGLTRSECEAVVYKALQVSRHVFCVMQNRYSPPAVWLRELLQAGRLGDIYSVQISCYWNRGAAYYERSQWKGDLALDGGVLFTQFSHFVDMLYWLFGDITDIAARFDDVAHEGITDFEDAGAVHFKLVNGGFGSLTFSTAVWDTNMESSLTVTGSRGSLKVGGQYMERVEYCHIEDYDMPELPPANPPNEYGPYRGSAANHAYVFQNVVDVLLHHRPIATNALEGLKVVDIIERIYASGIRPIKSR